MYHYNKGKNSKQSKSNSLNTETSLNKDEMQRKIESREEYKRQMQQYADRQIKKEISYRQFYKDYDLCMRQRMMMYVDNALAPEKGNVVLIFSIVRSSNYIRRLENNLINTN